jgi:hypothetical protein
MSGSVRGKFDPSVPARPGVDAAEPPLRDLKEASDKASRVREIEARILPSAEPPPPGFRQCVQYLLPVNEDKLPQCPEAFPDRLVFIRERKANSIAPTVNAASPWTDVQHSHGVVAHMKNAERAEVLRRRYTPQQSGVGAFGRHPFTTPIGRKRATFFAIPAVTTTSTTRSTSL